MLWHRDSEAHSAIAHAMYLSCAMSTCSIPRDKISELIMPSKDETLETAETMGTLELIVRKPCTWSERTTAQLMFSATIRWPVVARSTMCFGNTSRIISRTCKRVTMTVSPAWTQKPPCRTVSQAAGNYMALSSLLVASAAV